jgi:hypothetical protein
MISAAAPIPSAPRSSDPHYVLKATDTSTIGASITSDSLPTQASDDIALMRRFEPILCFNHGEQFYPMNADLYLTNASLWVRSPDTAPRLVVERGQLNDATLVRYSDNPDDTPGTVYYLSFADAVPPAERRAFRASSTLHETSRSWTSHACRIASPLP